MRRGATYRIRTPCLAALSGAEPGTHWLDETRKLAVGACGVGARLRHRSRCSIATDSGPLTALVALVAYSRAHTGVHYPLDVIAGAVTGVDAAPVAAAAARHLRPWASTSVGAGRCGDVPLPALSSPAR